MAVLRVFAIKVMSLISNDKTCIKQSELKQTTVDINVSFDTFLFNIEISKGQINNPTIFNTVYRLAKKLEDSLKVIEYISTITKDFKFNLPNLQQAQA